MIKALGYAAFYATFAGTLWLALGPLSSRVRLTGRNRLIVVLVGVAWGCLGWLVISQILFNRSSAAGILGLAAFGALLSGPAVSVMALIRDDPRRVPHDA